MSYTDEKEWKGFVDFTREHIIHQMMDSAFVMSLAPGTEPDLQFAVELGLSIMFNKPIMVVVFPGREPPAKLLEIADEVVYADIDTPEGQADLKAAIDRMVANIEEGP